MMQTLRSLFIRATGLITAHPSAERFHLDEIDDPFTFFQLRLDPSLTEYDHIACDVSDNCNLRCPFCINDFAEASSQRMRPEHFENIVRIAPMARKQSVLVSCLCEPLLHPKLLDLLSVIPPNLRDRFAMTTNLSTKRLNESFFEDLAARELHHVNISVDSLQKQVFEEMRANAKYEVFTGNLEKLAAVFATAPNAPELRFITVAARSNYQEIPSLIQVANERYGVGFYEMRYPFDDATPEGPWKTNNLLTVQEWDALVDRVTELPYPTHVTRGTRLTLCGFGKRKVVSEKFGSNAPAAPALPWPLRMQIPLRAVVQPLRRLISKHAGWARGADLNVEVAVASADGVLHLVEPRCAGAFSAAARNTGETGTISILLNIPEGLSGTICETDPSTGHCLTSPGPSLSMTIQRNATKTFSVFVARKPFTIPPPRDAAIDILMVEHGILCGANRVAIVSSPSEQISRASERLSARDSG